MPGAFATPVDVGWWSETWAERLSQSNFGQQAVEHGLTDSAELAQLAQGWLQWGRLPDAWFSVLHAEVLCRCQCLALRRRFAPRSIFK